MENDKDAFLKAMEGVKPIDQDKADTGEKDFDEARLQAQRDNALAVNERESTLSDHLPKMLSPHDVVGFKQSGVQDGVYKKLRLGKYDIDARLDLHRHTVKEARKALEEFIRQSMEYDLRTVIVLHGKGDRDPDRKAVLKSYVSFWLEEIDDVLAFHTAQPFHGGSGALYILLRKSEDAKQRNREKHGGR